MPSVTSNDPLVLRVVEVTDDGYAAIHTIQKSAPEIVLNRSTMRVRDVIDTGVLVAGPGALDAIRRRAQTAHLRDLLAYAARRTGAPAVAGDVRFDGRELVALVAADEKLPRGQARAILRDALATLGGREITSAYDPAEIGYVIPAAALEP